MNDCHKEFATLVKATLHYLQDEWSDFGHIELKSPSTIPIPETPKIEADVKPEPKPVLKKKEEPKPSVNWMLNPMPVPVEHALSYASFFKTIDLSIPIRLVVIDSSQTFFLENLARALTQFVAPAALFTGKLDTLLTNHNLALVLAPLSHLKKRFPQVELHQFLKLDGPTLLPLADHYDIDLKRALWNSLKNFPNLPPSS